MDSNKKIIDVTADLESLLTFLAKESLKALPDNVEVFCLEVLARKHGLELSSPTTDFTKAGAIPDEDMNALQEDVNIGIVSDFTKKRSEPRQRAYQSSDESDDEEEVKRVSSYYSSEFRFDAADDYISDEEGNARVRTVVQRDIDVPPPRPVCYLFSKEKITENELNEKTKLYQEDERMKSLFRAWDGDSSGAVDFVELVLALHKFKEVGSAGIDIQVASDALLEFVESDTERELKYSEFTKVIILFALNNFSADFEDVANHMLDVALGTSEAAVLQAKSGKDVSEIEAADKAEEEFLRETVKGMEEQVTDSIRKLRTKRVAFRQSNGLEQDTA